VADDFMDITSPLKALSDAAVAPFGKLGLPLVYFIKFFYYFLFLFELVHRELCRFFYRNVS